MGAGEDVQLSHVPDWGKSAVWYQIFPERFRNGDTANDPTREDLEIPFLPGENWRISPWTGDFYNRDEWEKEIGGDFYENGVFHRRYGGDLQGVIDKLDYLKDLGINAIYFNPVFYARSVHKYDGNSFHHIDPNFGPDPAGDFEILRNGGETADPATWKWTAADKLFLELIKQAHARGIRVVIDGVFNHSGRDFFAFRDIRMNGEKSPYTDWYYIESFDNPETRRNELRYKGWAGFFTLPEFRNNEDGTDLHPGPKQYIFDATRRWMDPDGDGNPVDGIDGWRLDVSEEIPDKFWRDWNEHVFKLNPQAITIAEVWTNAAHYLTETGFSATMNYYAFAVPVKAFLVDNSIKPSQFGEMLNTRRDQLPVPVQLAMQNLTDSHDTDRIAQMIVNRNTTGQYKNAEKFDYDEPGNSARSNNDYQVRKPNGEERAIQRLVTLFQLTYVGAPMFFYGVEAGMWGGDDPDCRKPMAWEDQTFEAETIDPRGRPRPEDDPNFDKEIHGFFQSAIALHAGNPAFKTPDFAVLAADDDRNVFVYSRGTGSDLRVVALNRSGEEQVVKFPGSVRKVIFATNGDDSAIKVSSSGGSVELVLPPLTGVVLE
ncbi:MAG: alpha-amylase [Chthoniobacterales bacterium]|nr:alpha-amylase [Chthoniobacterales bacterium]